MKNLVREIRQRKGISGEKLARSAEISSSDLSKLERGLLPAYPSWQSRISKALDTPAGVLFPTEVLK